MGLAKGLMHITEKRRSMLQSVMQGLRLGWFFPTTSTVKYRYEFVMWRRIAKIQQKYRRSDGTRVALNQSIIMHLPNENITILNTDSIFHRLENQTSN